MKIVKDLKKRVVKIGEKVLKLHPKHDNLTECGKEVLDPTPVEVPVRIKRLLENSMNPREQLKNMLNQEKMRASMEGYETEEEFNDFEDDDSPAKSSAEFEFDLHQELLQSQNHDFQPEEPVESPLEEKPEAVEPQTATQGSVEGAKDESSN